VTRILLSRTDAIGDLILTLPVARSIKESYPDMHITMMVSEYTEQLLEAEYYIDGVLAIHGREPTSYAEVQLLAKVLRRGAFDMVVFFYPRFSLAVASRKAGVKRRIGSGYRLYSFLFNEKIRQHRKHSGKHELDLNYDLVADVFPGLNRYESRLTVTQDEISAAQDILRQAGADPGEQYLVVHPFSKGSAPNWRPENYGALIRQIAAAGARVIVTGSLSERERAADFLAELPDSAVNLAGMTNLRQLKGLIKNAAMVVTSSTGPIHVAAAVGTFAVGIYPPIDVLSPVRWGPRGGANKLFVPEVTPGGREIAASMDQIKVADVCAFILSKLRADIRLEHQ
jgi:heptosyltransferase III